MSQQSTLPSNATPAGQHKLDDLMLAMDVVDTLRHNEAMASKELSQDQHDAVLRQRLRDIYTSQGIDVPDSVIDEGIKALQESRFVYTPVKTGLSRRIAVLWVRRRVVGRWIAGGLAAIGISVGGYYFGIIKPQRDAVETAKIELSQTLPQALNAAKVAVDREAEEEDARRLGQQLFDESRAALNRSDNAGAKKALAGLQGLEARLRETYALRIVTGSGERSGVFRIPDVNTQARNYYLIVEAVGSDGQALTRTITSEETSKTKRVTKWGVRVAQSVYDGIRLDKQDDGIIQRNRLGEKRRGKLNPDYVMPVMGGTITEW